MTANDSLPDGRLASEILQCMKEGVIATDARGAVVTMNRVAETLTGWQFKDAVGKNLWEIFRVSIPQLDGTQATFNSMSTDVHSPSLLAGLKGGSVPIEYTFSYCRSAENTITGFVVVFRDISERSKIEEMLKHSRNKYKGLVDSIEGIVWEADPGRHWFSFVSKQSERILGYSREQWFQLDFWHHHLHPEDRAWAARACGPTEPTSNCRLEYRMMTADGRELWLRDIVVAVLDRGVTKHQGVMMDITESRENGAVLRLLHKAIETMRLGVTISDSAGSLVYINASQANMLGYKTGELMGRSHGLISPHALPAEHRGQWKRESVNIKKDGTRVPVYLISDEVVDEDGRSLGIVTTCEDLTQRKLAQERLIRSEQRFRDLVQAAQDLIYTISSEEGFITSLNAAFEKMTGWARQDWLGMSFLPLIHPEDRAAVLLRHERLLRNEAPPVAEIRIRTRSGEYVVGEFTNMPLLEDGKVTGIFGIVRDITDRKRTEEQLIRNAFCDRLTGLPNRTLFLDRLGQSLIRCRRQLNYMFAVIFLDLDHFKMVNDSLGHLIGDLLLVHIGKRLKDCIRPEDTVARFGGDEFAILVENIQDMNDVTHVADRIQSDLMLPVRLEGHEVFSNCSIGIAMGSSEYAGCEEILRDADIAMYRAKDLGRGRFEIFDVEMHARVVERLQLETDLRRAIEREEFELHYQPIVSIQNGRIAGMEALLRWNHPLRGQLPPADFIRVAEETGVIVPIGWWILEKACRQMSEWRKCSRPAEALVLSVNLSAKQFAQPDLPEKIQEILWQTSFPPSRLNLEITESVLMESAEIVNVTLCRLKEMGIHLQIDDFGTGYSSLSYLHRFSIDMLKIDRSFVQRIESGNGHREIVRTIVTLGQSLHIPVTAEGVESEEQYAALRILGCEYAQGYLLGRPLPGHGFSDLIDQMQPAARVNV